MHTGEFPVSVGQCTSASYDEISNTESSLSTKNGSMRDLVSPVEESIRTATLIHEARLLFLAEMC